MRWEDIQARWDELSDHARDRWRELTYEDVQAIAGDRTLFVTTIQARHGLSAEDAENSVDVWLAELSNFLSEWDAIDDEPFGEAARHPGRDDFHEQRERDQECEGIVHWPPSIHRRPAAPGR